LPGVDTDKTKGKTGKGQADYSVALANALIAAQNELNPIKKIQLEYDAEILKINESKLKPERKRVALNAAATKLNERSMKLGQKMGEDIVSLIDKEQKRNEENKKGIQIREIEAGIIDEKEAQEIRRKQFIADLTKGNNQLTEDQLARINEAFDQINAKSTESAQLMKSIGQTLQTGIADAFMSIIDSAKSLRDVLSDVLLQTARLLLNFGIKAGLQAIPGLSALFASGGVMTSRGPIPLKQYARGGVANSPQLAMFGEGSTPEAYVPLPDGRSIPVKMKGGGDGGNVVVNVDAKGTSVQGDQPNSAALGRAIGAAVQAELIKQKRPGGLLA